MGCSPWGLQESDTTERLHFHFSLSCIGEGNGKPLQCSCLENPRDGGASWAAVYGVAQSRTRLKRLSSSSSSKTILRYIHTHTHTHIYTHTHTYTSIHTFIHIFVYTYIICTLYYLCVQVIKESLPPGGTSPSKCRRNRELCSYQWILILAGKREE